VKSWENIREINSIPEEYDMIDPKEGCHTWRPFTIQVIVKFCIPPLFKIGRHYQFGLHNKWLKSAIFRSSKRETPLTPKVLSKKKGT